MKYKLEIRLFGGLACKIEAQKDIEEAIKIHPEYISIVEMDEELKACYKKEE